PIERESHVFQVVYGFDGLPCQDLYGILVAQVIAAFAGVEHVPFPIVVFDISQGGADSTLSRPGMGTGGVEFAYNYNAGTLGCFQSGHQAGSSSAHDDHVILVKDHFVHGNPLRYCPTARPASGLKVTNVTVPATRKINPTTYRAESHTTRQGRDVT